MSACLVLEPNRMRSDIPNDNDCPIPGALAFEPDAQGEAALVLVERLIHALIETSIISVGRAVQVVEAAIEVRELATVEACRPAALPKRSRFSKLS